MDWEAPDDPDDPDAPLPPVDPEDDAVAPDEEEASLPLPDEPPLAPPEPAPEPPPMLPVDPLHAGSASAAAMPAETARTNPR
jgi:hypothetical protein